MSSLGQHLRALRTHKDRSLKTAAPDLGVSHAYLSKLENDMQLPSQELLHRIAEYYDVDYDVLSLLAGKIPEDILESLQANPQEAARVLRERFGRP